MVTSAAAATKPSGRRILGLDRVQRREERRRLLHETALELFGTVGYANTSVEQLCHTAGIGTNSFYELCDGKEQLFIEVYDAQTDRLLRPFGDPDEQGTGGDDPIETSVGRFLHAALDDPRVARIVFLEVMGIGAEIEAHRARRIADFVGVVERLGTQLVAAGIAGSEGRDLPAGMLRRHAVAVVGAIVALVAEWVEHGEDDSLEGLVDDVTFHARSIVDALVAQRRAVSTSSAAPGTARA